MEHLQFDGFPVEVYDGKLSGAFDVDEHVAQRIAHGDEVVFLVTATAKGASFTDTKDNQVKRTNTFKVSDALVVDDEALIESVTQAVIDAGTQSVNGQVPGQLTTDSHVEEPEADLSSELPAAEAEVFSPQPDIAPTDDPILQRFLEGEG